MNNKSVIFLKPEKYRDHDLIKYELDYFNKDIEIIFIEINNIIFGPNKKKNSKNKKIISINNYKSLYHNLKKLLKKYENIFIVNLISRHSIKSIIVNIIIYYFKKKIKIIEILNSGFPEKIIQKNYSNSKYLLKLNILHIKRKIENYICKIFDKIYRFSPHYKLVAGKKNHLKYKNSNFKLINISSWDISNIYARKIKPKNLNKIVYIDGANPLFFSDLEILNYNKSITLEWYKSLNKFFTFIESKLNYKIIICPHPDAQINDNYKKILCYRKISSADTIKEISEAKIIFTRQSTASAVALHFKKPLFFLYSNEVIKDYISFNVIKNLSILMKKKAINIDNYFNEFEKIKKIKFFKNDYFTNYLSYKKLVGNKNNTKILNNIIVNNDKLYQDFK
jgi:hypothetical protein